MKINYTLCLFACLFTNIFFAQQNVSSEFKNKTLQVFQNLDKNRIPHDVLLDYGIEFSSSARRASLLEVKKLVLAESAALIYRLSLNSKFRHLFRTPSRS